MIYISKGTVQRGSTEEQIRIIRGGQASALSGKEAELWLRGRFSFAFIQSDAEATGLQKLISLGLAEAEKEENETAQYRILTRCVCCPSKASKRSFGLPDEEKTVLFWLVHAGLRLSTAELVYLIENKVEVKQELLSAENRQALVETIYTADTIADNILEAQMEKAECRDRVVHTLLSLLRKKKILML